jgi:hypothetical protein
MPRRKQALVQKKAEERRLQERKEALALKKEKLAKERREKREQWDREKDRQLRLWEKKFRPQVGHVVLYIERGIEGGYCYEDRFLGPVTRTKFHRNHGTFDFEVRFSNYRNHRVEACETSHNFVCEEGKYQFLTFNQRYLIPSLTESVCYTDFFVRHLRREEDYKKLMMKTYYIARKNAVFPKKNCYHGKDCKNMSVRHLINFYH